MKMKKDKFRFDLNNLELTETCKFSLDFPKKFDFKPFLEMCEKGEVHTAFGTKEEPNTLTAYECTFETTEWAGRKIYIILNQFKGKKTFVCSSFFEEDIKVIIIEYTRQYICAFANAA
jgi:hypothetical protein